MRLSRLWKQSSGSKAIEPFDEGPRIAGIGAAKWSARDALVATIRNPVRAGDLDARLT